MGQRITSTGTSSGTGCPILENSLVLTHLTWLLCSRSVFCAVYHSSLNLPSSATHLPMLHHPSFNHLHYMAWWMVTLLSRVSMMTQTGLMPVCFMSSSSPWCRTLVHLGSSVLTKIRLNHGCDGTCQHQPDDHDGSSCCQVGFPQELVLTTSYLMAVAVVTTWSCWGWIMHWSDGVWWRQSPKERPVETSQWLAVKARVGSLVTARLCATLTCAVASRRGINATQHAIGTTTSATTMTTMNKGVGGAWILIKIEWGNGGRFI